MSADSSRRHSNKQQQPQQQGSHQQATVGQIVLPQAVNDPSIIESVAGFIHEVVPQAYSSVLPGDSRESITWARFETCDYNDLESWSASSSGDYGDDAVPPLLLVLGYGTGVQVWSVSGGGEATEVLSWWQGCVVRTLRLLYRPLKMTAGGDPTTSPLHSSRHPIVAVVDSAGPSPPFCTLNFISLKTAEVVKSIKFKTPICDVLCNKKSIVVTFAERIAIFDAVTLEDRMTITTCYPSPGVTQNPVALGARWLAYAEKRLTTWQRSSGGCEGEGAQSYTATVIHAAKSLGKGLRDLSGSLTGSVPQPTTTNSAQPGIVTVLDIENKGTKENIAENIVAHFVAHVGPIVAMAFDFSGMLLVTADKHGHRFHIFRIHPHPCSPALAAVHHLYTLHRGDTTARVQDIAVSWDSRWVAVSSVRGTTHVFPITPYGGPVAVRTHTTPHVVNRLSRFERSAGLSDGRGSPVGEGGGWPPGNPRLPPYPHPTVVTALAQLRRWHHCGVGVSCGGAGSEEAACGGSVRLAACFAPPRAWLPGRPRLKRTAGSAPPVESLFVMASHGNLIQYDLDARCISGVPKDKISYDTGIELGVEAKAEWVLLKPPHGGGSLLQPPLGPTNQLLLAAAKRNNQHPPSSSSRVTDDRWLSQVEIITHTGPHRRLWMGPQFSFKTIDSVPQGLEGEEKENESLPARSNPVNMPHRPYLLIESGSGGSVDLPHMTDFAEDGDESVHRESRLREDLADAMLDHTSQQSSGVVGADDGRGFGARGDGSSSPVLEHRVNPIGTVVALKKKSGSNVHPQQDPQAARNRPPIGKETQHEKVSSSDLYGRSQQPIKYCLPITCNLPSTYQEEAKHNQSKISSNPIEEGNPNKHLVAAGCLVSPKYSPAISSLPASSNTSFKETKTDHRKPGFGASFDGCSDDQQLAAGSQVLSMDCSATDSKERNSLNSAIDSYCAQDGAKQQNVNICIDDPHEMEYLSYLQYSPPTNQTDHPKNRPPVVGSDKHVQTSTKIPLEKGTQEKPRFEKPLEAGCSDGQHLTGTNHQMRQSNHSASISNITPVDSACEVTKDKHYKLNVKKDSVEERSSEKLISGNHRELPVYHSLGSSSQENLVVDGANHRKSKSKASPITDCQKKFTESQPPLLYDEIFSAMETNESSVDVGSVYLDSRVIVQYQPLISSNNNLPSEIHCAEAEKQVFEFETAVHLREKCSNPVQGSTGNGNNRRKNKRNNKTVTNDGAKKEVDSEQFLFLENLTTSEKTSSEMTLELDCSVSEECPTPLQQNRMGGTVETIDVVSPAVVQKKSTKTESSLRKKKKMAKLLKVEENKEIPIQGSDTGVDVQYQKSQVEEFSTEKLDLKNGSGNSNIFNIPENIECGPSDFGNKVTDTNLLQVSITNKEDLESLTVSSETLKVSTEDVPCVEVKPELELKDHDVSNEDSITEKCSFKREDALRVDVDVLETSQTFPLGIVDSPSAGEELDSIDLLDKRKKKRGNRYSGALKELSNLSFVTDDTASEGVKLLESSEMTITELCEGRRNKKDKNKRSSDPKKLKSSSPVKREIKLDTDSSDEANFKNSDVKMTASQQRQSKRKKFGKKSEEIDEIEDKSRLKGKSKSEEALDIEKSDYETCSEKKSDSSIESFPSFDRKLEDPNGNPVKMSWSGVVKKMKSKVDLPLPQTWTANTEDKDSVYESCNDEELNTASCRQEGMGLEAAESSSKTSGADKTEKILSPEATKGGDEEEVGEQPTALHNLSKKSRKQKRKRR